MRTRVGIVLFAVIVIGGIIFFATRIGTHESSDVLLEQESAPASVELSRSYAKGAYTFTGTRSMPTSCDSVVAEAVLTEQGGIEVHVTETFADGMCLMRITPMKFSATVTAPEDAPVTVFINNVSTEAIFE